MLGKRNKTTVFSAYGLQLNYKTKDKCSKIDRSRENENYERDLRHL